MLITTPRRSPLEGALPIGSRQCGAPDASERNVERSREEPHVVRVEVAQRGESLEHGVFGMGAPRQSNQPLQQGAYGTHALDEPAADDLGAGAADGNVHKTAELLMALSEGGRLVVKLLRPDWFVLDVQSPGTDATCRRQ